MAGARRNSHWLAQNLIASEAQLRSDNTRASMKDIMSFSPSYGVFGRVPKKLRLCPGGTATITSIS
jgi:hypothetical protein